MSKVGTELFLVLLKVQRADATAQSDFRREEKFRVIEEAEERYYEVLAKKQCVSMKELAINGRDLIENGVEPGVMMGAILNSLLEQVIEDPTLNEKDILLSLVAKQQKIK